MKLPEGCSIEWMRHSDKERRLINWLESHPAERICLFDQDVYHRSTKAECAIRAAKAIFADDENPRNSYEVRNDPRPFAQSIRNHIRLAWRSKYQKVNTRLGPTAAMLPYSDFEPGSETKRIADIEIRNFPQWRQLHGWWRELPQFNQFADPEFALEQPAVKSSIIHDDGRMDNESTRSNSGFGGKRKRSSSGEFDEAAYNPSGSPEPVSRRPKKSRKSFKRRNNERRSAVPSSGSVLGTPPTNTDGEEIDHNEDHKHSANDATNTLAVVSQYTPDQQFQLELAKIQREMQAEHNKALEMAQKREVFIMLFGRRNT